jgi:serine/threonine protein kinase
MTDRYQIISLLEKDKLGSIYLARDTTLQRKVVYRNFDIKAGDSQPEGFSLYTGKLCALQHPNLLTIYDIATQEDGYFMVSQFLEGESLEERLSRGALNQVGVHNMACDLLDALHSAHSSGLYHGALRTDSIIRLPRVRGGHRYLIVDFGLDRISSMICGKSVFMADPVLMAPELVDGQQEPNEASDLFTLGQLCYISLVGGHPYAGKTPQECAQAYRDGGLPHLNTYVQGVQPEFADWVMWLVSGPVEKRPSTSQQAMEALHRIRLDAPAPNVPGKTQALESPQPQPKISATVNVVANTSPQKPIKRSLSKSSKPQSKEKRVLLGAVGVVVFLLAILMVVLIFRFDDWRSTKTDKDASATAVEPMVVLGKTQLINQILIKKDPVTIPLDSGKTVDWTVVKGAPASSKRVMMKGGVYIRNIFAVGEFTEFIESQPMNSYSFSGVVIAPQKAVTNAKKGKAKEGEGWEVAIRVPETHQGPLLVTVFMLQKHCDFDVEVRSTHEINQGGVVRVHVPATTPGLVRIPLRIPNPVPGYYSIRILAGSVDVAKGFEMGLSAILLERL